MSKPAYLIGAAFYPQGHAPLTEYAKACAPIFKQYGAVPLAIGNTPQEVQLLEGNGFNSEAKVSIVKFPSMLQLTACFNDERYLAIKHLRSDIIDTDFSLAIEGF